MDLSDLKSELGEKSDQELMDLLQGIRQNRRTPAARPKAETKKTTNKSETISLDALLASALQNPEMKAALLAQLKGGKK